MQGKPTLKDICREASVSAATVSRVINNSPLVHETTRQHVQEVIERLGYTPNVAARSLSRNRTDLIGLVFHQISTGFYASVMEGIDQQARLSGYHILTAFSRDTAEERELCLTFFDAARVDGLIVLDSGLEEDTIQQLKSHTRPFVLLQKELKDQQINTVSCSNEYGAFLAMQHLIRLDYKHILIMTGPEHAQDAQLRLRGCRRALKDHDLRFEPHRCVCGHFSPDLAPKVFQDYTDNHGLPRAVFALNDAMALAIIKHLRGAGISVPEQVAVVGFDGIACGNYMGLTTVQTPITAMGQEAVKLLLENIQSDESKPRQIQLEAKLVVRETCGANG